MNLNAELTTLTEGDSELCNVVLASGPGDGIQAMLLTLRNQTSVDFYGEYPKSVTFAQAVSEADLRVLALAYLEQHSNPLEALQVRAVFEEGYDPDIEQGDTVTFASVEAGITVTERIVEIAHEVDGVTFSLKSPRGDLTNALLDQLGEEDRKKRALGLPAPQAFTCTTARPGVRLKFNPYVGSRAQGVEIHASLEPNFEPDSLTFVRKTADTEVHLSAVSHLPLAARWYVKIAAYADAERGEFSEELSAIAGYITTDVLDPKIEEALDQAAADERIADLIEEVKKNSIFTGAVTAWSADSITDSSKNYPALGVTGGWSLKFLSGPLKYRTHTVVTVRRIAVDITPAIPAGLILAGAEYELASSPNITTLGTTGIVVELSKPPGQSTFSSIKQMSDEIALSVVRDAEQYSQLALLEDEIDLRVVKGDMVASLNLDPTGVRISGKRLQLDGETSVNGNLAITGGPTGTYGNRIRVLDIGNQEQMAFGYISGRPWGSGVLPTNTWGIWAQNGGVFMRGVPRIVAVGRLDFTQLDFGLSVPGNEFKTGSWNREITEIPDLELKAGEKLVVALDVMGVDVSTGQSLVGHKVTPIIKVGGSSSWSNLYVPATFQSATTVNAVGADFFIRARNPNSSSETLRFYFDVGYQVYIVG